MSTQESSPYILYQDEHVAAFYKPSGFHVHPHEQAIHRVHRSQVLLYQARDLVGQYVYPVHRLDAGTSGVILFALSSVVAKELAFKFQSHDVHKTYEVVVRGYTSEEGSIDLPLESESTEELMPAHTDFQRLATVEFPVPVGRRHPTARYSLVRAFPKSGRFHQIRRHFGRQAHPVLGDAAHGDSKHNQFFREQLKIAGLCLRASEIRVPVSWLPEPLSVKAPACTKWTQIYTLFNFKPHP